MPSQLAQVGEQGGLVFKGCHTHVWQHERGVLDSLVALPEVRARSHASDFRKLRNFVLLQQLLQLSLPQHLRGAHAMPGVAACRCQLAQQDQEMEDGSR